MVDRKTIDDIGIDVSKQYAEFDQSKDNSLQEASSVTQHSIKDRNAPVYTTELAQTFQTDDKNHPFGETRPPVGYETMTNRAFTHTFIPSIGETEKIEMNIQRVKKQIEQLKAKLEKIQEGNELNFVENEISAAQNVLLLLELILGMIKDEKIIHGGRKSNQKG